VKKLLDANEKESNQSVVFFDLCSGKGFLSCLLSFMYPDSQIYQIDINKTIKLDHIKSLSNVEFYNCDIFKPTMKDWMSQRVSGKIGVILGIHLCGELSYQLISYYHQIPELKYMLLCPCCISKKNQKLLQTSKDLNIDNYHLWTMELYYTIHSTSKFIGCDQKITSHKNNFIGAQKTNTDEQVNMKETLQDRIRNKYCAYLER